MGIALRHYHARRDFAEAATVTQIYAWVQLVRSGAARSVAVSGIPDLDRFGSIAACAAAEAGLRCTIEGHGRRCRVRIDGGDDR